MEAHKGILQSIRKFALDALFVHILRNGVVDIQQGNGILTDAGSDELAECSVDINLTGYRNSSSCKAAVYIAGNKTELGLECRPAFSCDGHILTVALVCLYPVKKGQLVLSQFRQDLGFPVTLTQLCLHILYNLRDSRIIGMFVIGLEKIKFGVLLDFNAQVVKLLDRRIAGKEV